MKCPVSSGLRGTQPADGSDTLPQLHQRRAGQLVGQAGLSHQDDLQQLRLRRFEVREQAYGLEHRRIQVLCFIDDNDKALTRPRFLYQATVELLVHADEVLRIRLNADFCQQEPHELARTALRLEQERGTCCTVKFREQVKQQRGLAHPRSRNQGEKAAVRLDAVIQRRQGFAMARSQVEIPWVRGHTERLFSQAEKV